MLICISSLVSAQEEKEEKATASFSKGDSVMSYETIDSQTLLLPTAIKSEKQNRSDSWTLKAGAVEPVKLSRIKTVNHTAGGREEFILRIDYRSGGSLAKRKFLILEQGACKRVKDVLVLLKRDDLEGELRCQVNDKCSIGTYDRNGNIIYFLVIDDREFLFTDKTIFTGLLRKFTKDSADPEKQQAPCCVHGK
ncbi:hypothetical protein B0I18_104190 [Taibaiella chishuiensis]|uniref:Uncharacterized protein n=2 Tax=Taibaiella chishuiensis TaxID=1434707 RepID=A0A2P8D4F8_9BACT|nr:hypothetical protein B0I18_104190 [Taibaiella chishuiensis]